MRRVRYAVGMSLDGYLADLGDDTTWMTGDPGYDAVPFFSSIDAVVVGRRSYQVMLMQGLRTYPGLLVGTVEVGISPIVLGSGRSFCRPPGARRGLRLSSERSFPSGLLVLHSDVVRNPEGRRRP